jgi:hypothetical protein
MSGSDAVMLDKLSCEVPKHSFSVLCVTAKLADVLLVPHFNFVDFKYKFNYKLIKPFHFMNTNSTFRFLS